MLLLRGCWRVYRTPTHLDLACLNLIKDFLKMVQVRGFLEGRVCCMLCFARVAADLVLSFAARNFLVNVTIVLLSSCCASSLQHSLRDATTGISINFHQVLSDFSEVVDGWHLNGVVLDFL